MIDVQTNSTRVNRDGHVLTLTYFLYSFFVVFHFIVLHSPSSLPFLYLSLLIPFPSISPSNHPFLRPHIPPHFHISLVIPTLFPLTLSSLFISSLPPPPLSLSSPFTPLLVFFFCLSFPIYLPLPSSPLSFPSPPLTRSLITLTWLILNTVSSR